MVNVILILTSVAFAVLVLISSLYFLVHFQDPSDKWEAWFPKIVVVLGVSIACYNVLLLPLNVANQSGEIQANGGLPMNVINLVFFIATIVFVLLVVPFTIFYYEGYDGAEKGEKSKSQLWNAIVWTVPTIIIFVCILVPLYITAGYAEIPVAQLSGTFVSTTNPLDSYCSNNLSCSSANVEEKIKVSLTVYTIALATFLGWFLFAVFGGIGLFAFPIEMIQDYIYRPRPISNKEYKKRKALIGEESCALLKQLKTINSEKEILGNKVGSKLNSRSRALRKMENAFIRDVLLLEEDHNKLEDSYDLQRVNPLMILGKLVIGILSMMLSIAWTIHIALYLLPEAIGKESIHPFLNTFFTALSNVPLLGPSFYGLFAFYLLLCCIKGNVKMGMRLLIFSIHPIKYKIFIIRIGATMLSSLVFNTGLILICSLATVQFCVSALQEYARYTSIAILFSTQIQNLAYIKYVYPVRLFIFCGFAALTLIYFAFKPNNRRNGKVWSGKE